MCIYYNVLTCNYVFVVMMFLNSETRRNNRLYKTMRRRTIFSDYTGHIYYHYPNINLHEYTVSSI